MERIRNSWALGKVSWSILRSDRTLAVFPLLSVFATLGVFGLFAGLVALTGLQDGAGNDGLEPIGWVFVGCAYFALAFVATFFTAALVHGANERLEGRGATLGECLGSARSKLHRLLPWAIVQATVSVIIRTVEERFGIVGQIMAGLLGAAWGVVTFLTIPVIMLEDLGPIAALKRSGALLSRTWGENIAAQFGFGLLALVASLPGMLLIGLGVGSGSLVVAVALGIVGGAWIVVVSLAVAAMTGIYQTALYRFAVDDKAPAAFAGSDLDHAFGPRRGRLA